jgi:hypothetical protein
MGVLTVHRLLLGLNPGVDVGSDQNQTPIGPLDSQAATDQRMQRGMSLFCGEERRGFPANQQKITNVLV